MNLSKRYTVLPLLTVMLLLSQLLSAQILDPVKWKFYVKESVDGMYDLVSEASIDETWHLYTQKAYEVGEGPLPTVFTFEKNESVQLIGSVEESESITHYEEIWEAEITFFEDRAFFTQRVRKLRAEQQVVKGYLEFMTCDDKTCLPPEYVDFEFVLPATSLDKVNEGQTEVLEVASDEGNALVISETPEIYDPVKWEFNIEEKGDNIYRVIASATIEDTWHLYGRELEGDEGPIATEFTIDENKDIEIIGEIQDEGDLKTEYDPNFMMDLSFFENEVRFVQEFKLLSKGSKVSGSVFFMCCDNEKCLPPEEVIFDLEVGDAEAILEEEIESEKSSLISGISFWATFIKGFLGGFLALLTPCVFPMIPLTVSFFTKQSKTKAQGISNAILYGISIIAIYVLLGYGVTVVFGADALNALSTNVWFNLAFFLLLVVFAISFFGAFEITLPSSWVNKADSASDKGGIMGVFFMAFTLCLVSFSCTGPIIGTLLVDAAVNGGILGPLVGMFGFSLALALPFALFAAFPGWLNSLPSSGGWLNTVKVVLGFIELAFAFKFLSNADLVVQAGLLKRELFIAIWIAIFALLTMYLLGMFTLPHDSKVERISVTRLMLAILTLMFTIYLIPGIWGAPLKLISGFPPPMFYSESPQGVGGSQAASVAISGAEVVGEPETLPP